MSEINDRTRAASRIPDRLVAGLFLEDGRHPIEGTSHAMPPGATRVTSSAAAT
jgi:hypothetical protein